MKLHDNGVADFLDISEVAIADGLVAWYPLNGDAKDHTINRNDGTVYGAVPAAGVGGKLAYEFDGVDDYVDCGTNNAIDLPIISISLWFKTSSIGEMKLFKTSDTFENNYGVTMNNSGYMVIITDDNDFINFQTSAPFNDNIWHHFVGITNSNLAENKIYIDGALKSGAQRHEVLVGSGNYTRISGRPVDSYNFDGKIQDVRIYNRALSAEEIKILYDMTGLSLTTMKQSNNTVYLKGEIQETL